VELSILFMLFPGRVCYTTLYVSLSLLALV
jgi:hypothetical protein